MKQYDLNGWLCLTQGDKVNTFVFNISTILCNYYTFTEPENAKFVNRLNISGLRVLNDFSIPKTELTTSHIQQIQPGALTLLEQALIAYKHAITIYGAHSRSAHKLDIPNCVKRLYYYFAGIYTLLQNFEEEEFKKQQLYVLSMERNLALSAKYKVTTELITALWIGLRERNKSMTVTDLEKFLEGNIHNEAAT